VSVPLATELRLCKSRRPLKKARSHAQIEPPASSGWMALLVRVSLGVVALVCVLAQLASAAHFVLVGHGVCSEHGELVHEGEGSAHSFDSARERGAKPADAHTALVTEVVGDHDHCTLLCERRERLALPPQNFCDAPLPHDEATATLTGTTSAGVPAVPLLLVAPKGSPPA
jgi:hypothetical protein